MIRVASVAKMICDNADVELDTKNIVSASLVHDMGNLIKSDLKVFPDFFQPEGVAHWEGVKADMIAKYGENEHRAAIAMIKEMGVSQEVRFYFEAFGHAAATRVYEGDSLGEKIATYSDMRVGPHGIVSLKERMNDLRKRYTAKNVPGFDPESVNERAQMLREIETEIFNHCRIPTDAINDKTASEVQKRLWEWEIV